MSSCPWAVPGISLDLVCFKRRVWSLTSNSSFFPKLEVIPERPDLVKAKSHFRWWVSVRWWFQTLLRTCYPKMCWQQIFPKIWIASLFHISLITAETKTTVNLVFFALAFCEDWVFHLLFFHFSSEWSDIFRSFHGDIDAVISGRMFPTGSWPSRKGGNEKRSWGGIYLTEMLSFRHFLA